MWVGWADFRATTNALTIITTSATTGAAHRPGSSSVKNLRRCISLSDSCSPSPRYSPLTPYDAPAPSEMSHIPPFASRPNARATAAIQSSELLRSSVLLSPNSRSKPMPIRPASGSKSSVVAPPYSGAASHSCAFCMRGPHQSRRQNTLTARVQNTVKKPRNRQPTTLEPKAVFTPRKLISSAPQPLPTLRVSLRKTKAKTSSGTATSSAVRAASARAAVGSG